MATRIFDDKGGIWTAASAEFQNTFAIRGLRVPASEYAVRAFGFLAIDQFGAATQIRLDPSTVCPGSIAHAFDWLKSQRRVGTLTLALLDSEKTFALVPTLSEAVGRIYDAVSAASRRTLEPVIYRKTSASDIASNPLLSSMIAEWRSIVGESAKIDPNAFANRHLRQRYVVANGNPAALTFSSIGEGFGYYGAEWARSSVGRPIDAQPDKTYGHWVADSYRQASFAGEPQVHDCDALIVPRSGSRARLRIRRVVLPIPNTTLGNVVVGGSIYDDGVDLRQLQSDDADYADQDLQLRLGAARRKLKMVAGV